MSGNEIFTGVILPVVASVVVGMGSAYLTATTTLARMDEKLSAMEARVESLEGKTDKQQDLSERLIRVETKLDAVLERLERAENGERIWAR